MNLLILIFWQKWKHDTLHILSPSIPKQVKNICPVIAIADMGTLNKQWSTNNFRLSYSTKETGWTRVLWKNK